MISSTAGKTDTYEESGFNKATRIIGPILSTILLFIGVVIFWVGIGYYYGYWGMYMEGTGRALTAAGLSRSLLYTESVGGVYIFSAILATLALALTLLPIVLSRRMDNAGWVAGNLIYTLLVLGVATFILCSTIVACAYYAIYNHTTLIAGGCPNIIGLSPAGGDDYCRHFRIAYQLLITGHILSLIPIAWAALTVCQQLGKHNTASTTTYVERRTDVSVA